MPTFGLVVEGTYDEAALRELIQKCSPEEVEVIGRPCGGKAGLMRKFSGHLEGFRHIKEGTNLDKALVVRDADNKDPGELKETMQRRVSNRSYPFPIKLLVIVQAGTGAFRGRDLLYG
ncbi:MAG: hypothetical protein HYY89_03145 [candidate division NC10 bacterium]|nr:hypothetical protein [candidate division NC10 bacterium]